MYERDGSRDAIAGVVRERANIRLAVFTRFTRGDYGGAAAIVCDIAKLIIEIGSEAQLVDWFRSLAHAEDVDPTTLGHEPRIWIAFAELAVRGPAGADAPLLALDDAVAVARRDGDDAAVLTGLARIANSVRTHGDINRALQATAEGVTLAERLDLRRPLAEFSLWQGMLEHILGAFDDAFRHGDRALGIARELNDGPILVRATLLLDPLKRVAQPPAGVAEVVPTLDVALQVARDAGTALDEMYVLMQLAIHAAFEQRAEAFALAGDGLALANRTRSTPAEVVFVFALAIAAFVVGDDDTGIALHAALEPHRQLMHTLMPSATLTRYANLVDQRRSPRPVEFDELTRAASSALWPAAREAAVAYAAGRARPADATTLTNRELEVLRHLVRGESNPEIAAALGVRPKTVMHHCASIYRKLGVKSRVEATTRALRDGLVKPL
jgi:DNA-binding CsgD family transcriptional regulator